MLTYAHWRLPDVERVCHDASAPSSQSISALHVARALCRLRIDTDSLLGLHSPGRAAPCFLPQNPLSPGNTEKEGLERCLGGPAGLLQKVGMEGANEVRMEATPVASLQTLEKQFMAQLQHKAGETWNYPGDTPDKKALIACMRCCGTGR